MDPTPSPSSSRSSLRALESNVTALVELERLGSSLQLEMLENERRADGILNGLVINIGFLLLYTVGGLILQVSTKVGCWSAFFILIAVTITSAIGIGLAINMAKVRLERMNGPINELNKRNQLLTEEASLIRISEKERIDTLGEGEENSPGPLSMVRAASVVSRVNALTSSRDMSSFSGINRKIIRYILASALVYLVIVAIFFLFNNCGIIFFCRLRIDLCPLL